MGPGTRHCLYEIVPAGVEMDGPTVDPLKYQTPAQATSAASSDELLTVKLRHKAPDGEESRLISTTVRSRPQALTANLGFASAVAEVGMLLRNSKHATGASYEAGDEDGADLQTRRFGWLPRRVHQASGAGRQSGARMQTASCQ